jgi:hypothetical protein
MDETVDLRDFRGRLIRLVIALAIGVLVTIGGMSAADSFMGHDPAPLNLVSVVIMILAMFLAATALSLKALSALARRFRVRS